ncbi:MAG: hypothetical protein KTR25_04490 [Myxococcales bacterium]|nr:hypothetical protein [Myxococcales bacterium]
MSIPGDHAKHEWELTSRKPTPETLATGIMTLGLSCLPMACETVPTDTASRQWTSTVAIGTVANLHFDSPIDLSIVGERRNDVRLDLNLTVVASSTTAAEEAVATYDPTTTVADNQANIVFGPPEEGRLKGSVIARVPADVDLGVTQRGAVLQLEDMTGDIDIQNAGDISISADSNLVRVRCELGNVLIRSPVSGGSVLDVLVGVGSIQLELPSVLNARIEAQGTAGINSTHSQLPNRPGNVPYIGTTGSGSASIVATTRSGTILFTVRNGP